MKKNIKILLAIICCLLAVGYGASKETAFAAEKDTENNQEIKEVKGEVGTITLYELPGGKQDINIIEIEEQGSNIRKFRIEANVNGSWQTVYNNDLIEAYHLCALQNTVNTDAVRVVVEEEAAPSTIKKISARFLNPVQRTEEFTNTAYVSSTYFEHAWDNIHQDNFNSLTDIIMIGNFSFNSKGEFVIVKHGDDGLGSTPYPWNDSYIKGLFEGWKNRVTKNPNSRLWISITCLKEGTDSVPSGRTDAFHNQTARQAFIQDLITFAKEYNIAGFDIDWEYPGTSSQWNDYNLLISEAAVQLHNNGIMLSSAQAVGSGLNLSSLQALDRINIMAYDNYATMNNHSTFYNSAVKIIRDFKNKGIDESKLILGMPYYGVKVDSYFEQWDYSHIYDQMLSQQGSIDIGVNIYNKWGFNGVQLIRDKVVYAIEQNLGGVFIWQMKNDIPDFSSPYSLAGTTKKTIDEFTATNK